MALNDSFDVLLEGDEWMEVAAATGGFLAGTVAKNVIEGMSPFDIPDEAYGVAVMVGGQYAPMYQNEISLGGGIYTADKVLERFDLKSTVTSIGA